MTYTLGAINRTLTFTNVVTRTRASLTASGTLAIFIRLNSSGGQYTGIDYKWMKRASASSWVAATAEEIEKVYLEGWKQGLKAIAIYRDNSKRSQPLSTKKLEGDTATGSAADSEEIEKLTTERDALEARLADPTFYERDRAAFDDATRRIGDVRDRLEAAEERWLELEMQREALARE